MYEVSEEFIQKIYGFIELVEQHELRYQDEKMKREEQTQQIAKLETKLKELQNLLGSDDF